MRACFAAVLVLATIPAAVAAQSVTPQQQRQAIAQAQATAARALQPQLPMSFQGVGSLEEVTADGVRLEYVVKLPVPAVPQAALGAIQETAKEQVLKEFCANAQLAQMVSLGGEYEFTYVGSNDVEIYSILLDQRSCG